MTRHTLNLLTLLSPLLFAAVVALWLRGHSTGDECHLPPGGVSDVTPVAPTPGPDQAWRHQPSFHAGGGRLRVMRRYRRVAGPPAR